MIASTAILLLILIPILLSTLLSLTVVQNWVVQRATAFATEYVGAEVNIRHINVTMRGGILLSDVLIQDLQGDTMIYVKRLESQIVNYQPLLQHLHLGNSKIEGAQVNLRAREDEASGETMMNIKQIVNRISKRKGNGKFKLDIANISLSGSTLRIEQLTPNNPEYGVDFRRMEMNSLSGSVSLFSVEGSKVEGVVDRLYLEEKSGFEVNNMAGRLYVKDGVVSISSSILESRWSILDIDQLTLSSNAWSNYRYFEQLVDVELVVSRGLLASDDLGYWVPQARSWGLQLYDMAFDVRGVVDAFDLSITSLSYGEATSLSADMMVEGITDLDSANVDVMIESLKSSVSDIDQLKWSFTNRGFDANTLSRISSLGEVSLRGEIKGGMERSDISLWVDSGIGTVKTYSTLGLQDGVSINGELEMKSLLLGGLVQQPQLGRVTMQVIFDGLINGGSSDIRLSTNIDRLAWGKNIFREITLSGDVQRGGVQSVVVSSRDPHIDFDLTAQARNIFELEKSDIPEYLFDLNVNKLDFKEFNLNRRDSISLLTANISGRGGGKSIEECWGDLSITDGLYLHNADTLSISGAVAKVVSTEGLREILVDSDLATVEFSSKSTVAKIEEFLIGFLSRSLPALYDEPRPEEESEIVVVEGEQSLLQITTKDINPLVDAVSQGLKVGDGSNLTLRFNPESYDFNATIESPYLEQGSTLAIGVNIALDGRGDSLLLRSGVDELYVGTSIIEEASFVARAQDNKIGSECHFSNPADSTYASIALAMNLQRDSLGARELDLKLLPSTIDRRRDSWRLTSQDVRVNRSGIDINQFRIESRNQLMTINGKASNNIQDTVMMKMKNFDLSIFSSFISRIGYNIEGSTNGEAMVSALLGAGRLDAMVDLDSVSVNTLPAPAMSLRAEWDTKLNRARLHLTDRISRDTLVRGYYVPSEVRYYASLQVDSLQMAILDPPLGGVISQTEGLADLDLILQGVRRDAHLNGTITAHNVATTVDYTKVRYHLPRAVIDVDNNMLICNSTPINDGEGGEGDLQLEVDLKYLSNIGYKVRIAPRNLLVLDTSERDNDTFYGRVFASGLASIEGNKGGVKMDITARSEDHTQFFMPLANKANISTADFITFVQPTSQDTTAMTERRRLIMERSNRQRSGGGSVAINMTLDVRPNAELQLVIDPTVGDIIRARGEGQLNMKVEPQSNIFDMYGDYSITEGNYLFTLRNIVNKRFVIDPGSTIQWTGSPMDPILDINAIYQLKTSLEPLLSDESTRSVPIDCVINLSDRLTQPEVSFAIELPSADPEQQSAVSNLLNDQETISKQFFYLMLTNSFISDSSSGLTSSMGISTTATTGFELLTNQLSNWLSSSNYNVVIRYRPESELAGDEVDVGFSKGWIDNRLLIELEGNYIVDNKQAISDDASNFMGEAYITWLIDRAGALRLKGFTQTIDRYDENQGLQETGVGVYYRENFDNFKDLQNKVKARFRVSDERLERRRQHKEQRAAQKQERGVRREEEPTIEQEVDGFYDDSEVQELIEKVEATTNIDSSIENNKIE